MTAAILVRGAGAVCALGRDLPAIRGSAGREGFAGPAGERAAYAAPFEPARDLPGDLGRRLGRQPALALAAILEAVGPAVEAEGKRGLEDAALVMGTAHGPMHETIAFIEGASRHGPRFASPAMFAASLHNIPAGIVSRELGIRGPSLMVCNGDASFETALVVAVGMLRLGRAWRAVVAAADTYHPVYRDALAMLGGVSEDPHAPDPEFRRVTAGIHPGEGAGALLLEAGSPDAPGVRVEVAALGREALEPRPGIGILRLLSAGDARGVARHRASAARIAGEGVPEVTFPATRIGAFGSMGAVAAAVEADRLSGSSGPGGERVLLLQHPRGAPPAAVVLARTVRTA